METTQEIKIGTQTTEEILRTQNEEFLTKYPTDDAQIDYYTDLAMKVFEEFQIDGTFRQAGVRKNVATWFENKRGQMELFRKHPYWCEEAKAIIFSQTETRQINYNNARYNLGELYNYVCHKKAINTSQDVVAHIYYTLRDFEDEPEKGIATISEGFLNRLNERLSNAETVIPSEIQRILRVGTKITKLVHKCYERLTLADGQVFDATKLVDEHEPDDRSYQSFDKYYAKFADALSELTVKKITLVSLNFLDFMTMSNGNSWSSCHFINSNGIFHENADSSYHGQYKQGCLSYALDKPSFLLYTLPASFQDTDYYRCQKLTRMCCQYKGGVLITGKCYPNNEDNLITRYRQTLQTIISQVEGTPNLWTFSKNTGKIANFIETASGASHYEDYRHCEQKPTISLCRHLSIDLDKPMIIGSRAYCLHCGETIDNCDTSWLQCHRHRKSMRCQICGRIIEDGEEAYEIGDDIYCREHVFYCDYHKRYEPINMTHQTICTHNGNVVVCEYALDFMKLCHDCGVYERVDKMTADNGKYYCSKCVKKYTHCVQCGALIPKSKLRKPLCSSCKSLLKYGLHIIQKAEYDKDEYVLMKSDVSHCDYSPSIEMIENYPAKVVRVTWRGRSWGSMVYNVSEIDNHDWNWSANCFAGAIQGVGEWAIGKTLDEILAYLKENNHDN